VTTQASFHLLPAEPGSLVIGLTGQWALNAIPPDGEHMITGLDDSIRHLAFSSNDLEHWDTRLLIFVRQVIETARKRGITVDTGGLPPGAQRLYALAEASTQSKPYGDLRPESLVAKTGRLAIDLFRQGRDVAAFTGELALACRTFLSGRPPFRARDFFYFVQACGVEALPVVSLIAFLVGVILAFVGAVQLRMFGAQIYVANLVGVGMVLEMGALMSGVIVAGRTGASYAAQLGTMQVNEEIDALQTMGISPVGFLVLPRMFALMLMLPLLCIYADFLGILGGSFIGVTMLDLSLVEYLEQTRKTLQLNHIGQGLLKSAVFGVLIGYAGCLRGMLCGRSASAVGEATTSAVVTSIVLIVVADSIITLIINL
jgi:phospholipid/cholesterol/gamma-HCH transport system permease protein